MEAEITDEFGLAKVNDLVTMVLSDTDTEMYYKELTISWNTVRGYVAKYGTNHYAQLVDMINEKIMFPLINSGKADKFSVRPTAEGLKITLEKFKALPQA